MRYVTFWFILVSVLPSAHQQGWNFGWTLGNLFGNQGWGQTQTNQGWNQPGQARQEPTNLGWHQRQTINGWNHQGRTTPSWNQQRQTTQSWNQNRHQSRQGWYDNRQQNTRDWNQNQQHTNPRWNQRQTPESLNQRTTTQGWYEPETTTQGRRQLPMSKKQESLAQKTAPSTTPKYWDPPFSTTQTSLDLYPTDYQTTTEIPVIEVDKKAPKPNLASNDLNITILDDGNECPKKPRAIWRDFTAIIETKRKLCRIHVTFTARYKRKETWHQTWWGNEASYTYETVYDPEVTFVDLHHLYT